MLFPNGRLIDIPGNAFISPFDLNSVGKSEVSRFLHIVHDKKESEEEVTLFEEAVTISFFLNRALLSPRKDADLSTGVFKLAHFEKSQEII